MQKDETFCSIFGTKDLMAEKLTKLGKNVQHCWTVIYDQYL
jgi:hypothetical protein